MPVLTCLALVPPTTAWAGDNVRREWVGTERLLVACTGAAWPEGDAGRLLCRTIVAEARADAPIEVVERTPGRPLSRRDVLLEVVAERAPDLDRAPGSLLLYLDTLSPADPDERAGRPRRSVTIRDASGPLGSADGQALSTALDRLLPWRSRADQRPELRSLDPPSDKDHDDAEAY